MVDIVLFIIEATSEDIGKGDRMILDKIKEFNRKTILNRIDFCKNEDVAITNYGIVLAFLSGILDRSLEVFRDNNII